MGVRFVWGALLLVAPGPLLRMLSGRPGDGFLRVIVRILGARHIAEAIFDRDGSRGRLALSAAVDTVHAGSAMAWGILIVDIAVSPGPMPALLALFRAPWVVGCGE